MLRISLKLLTLFTAVLLSFNSHADHSDDNDSPHHHTPESSQSSEQALPPLAPAEKININTASLQQLTQLNGIGERRAQEIIRYREQQGDFTSVDELILIKGIGSATVERNRPLLAVE